MSSLKTQHDDLVKAEGIPDGDHRRAGRGNAQAVYGEI